MNRAKSSPIKPSPRHSSRQRGFTFLELVIVLGILSALFAIGIPQLTNLTPKYRLRSVARGLGTTLEHVRLSAMSRGLWMGIHYVLTPGPNDDTTESYYQIIPPAPAEFPDQPVDDRRFLPRETLGSSVRMAKVILSSGQVVDRGAINVLFSPMGNSGSHIVLLEEANGQILSLKMSTITGAIELIEQAEASFQHFDE